ncbi:DUF5133 domain-containing protein [Streptomyces sp. NPDC006487]|uniref:DUF5133 domain-containing protein n=1 Tax=Streptomyces sp. NPDC006487 TaxID=3364748 RepID=UPI00369276BE
MTAPLLHPARGTEQSRHRTMSAPSKQILGWAVGTLMVTTPAPAHIAGDILAAAAKRAALSETALAQVLLARSRGLPIPARARRALHRAVKAARTPDPAAVPWPSRLAPLPAEVGRDLGRFFEARLRLAAAPTDTEARREFEDTLFTLCILMGQPCPPAAVIEALQYVED